MFSGDRRGWLVLLVAVVCGFGRVCAWAQNKPIAGENTVLLIAREPFTGADVAEELNRHRLEGAA